jgi:integrase/recombinase XerC
MLEDELAPATVRRRIAALQRVIKTARRVGLTNLTLEVELPKAEAFRDTAGLGRKAWDQILSHVGAKAERGRSGPIRNRAILLLLHDRALRRTETATLDYPEDFDPARPAVAVIGKGRRLKEWLTINRRTADAISSWIATRGDWTGPLFIRTDNAAVGSRSRLNSESINRMVIAVAEAAGISRKVRAHGLRHSAITEALDSGYDCRDVRLFSGHAKIDTVLIYDDRRKDLGARFRGRWRGEKGTRRSPLECWETAVVRR